MRLRKTILTAAAFGAALVISAVIAGGSATIIEKRSRSVVRVGLETAGYSWAKVQTDGLQVILLGTAPSEAERFRALNVVSGIVDTSRIVDNTDAETAKAIAPPEFSLQILRNDEGISLIGLVPASTDRAALLETLHTVAGDGTVTDMLESADYPVPPGWDLAFGFGIDTLKTLPRAKISIAPGEVGVEAITDSPEEKARIETSLARRRPVELRVNENISAPRPVITPFTLRFLIDADGARFDACAADTERARDRILAAARDAGTTGTQGCTIGMGTPSPQWADAVVMGLRALKEIGAGTITFSNADIALNAPETVSQASFDKAVGELESNLPEVFSLKAELARKVEDDKTVPSFSAVLAENGKVELRGRVTSDRGREAVESYARAQFGVGQVYGATRVDANLPQGWPVRVLTALEALHGLAQGSVTVTPDLVTVSGITGDAQGSDKVARLFAQRLGEGATIKLDLKYDKRLDPVLGLPDGPECVSRLNAVLAANKINFEPSSAEITEADSPVLDALAKTMKQCQDFRMEVGGHTDSQGGEDSNLRLSQQRAQAVLAALRERRILTENLVARGYGESRPIADNGTEEGREENRRIEFVLLDEKPVGDGEPLPPATAEATTRDDAAMPDMDAAIAAAEAGGDGDRGEDAGPMEDATGEPLAGIGNDQPQDAAPDDAAPADQASAAPDGSIQIPVGTADESPARPKLRPKGLGPAQN